jgi:hypothetical protein
LSVFGSNYALWINNDPGDGTCGQPCNLNVQGANTVQLDTWQHVLGTWDGQELKMYLNGDLINTSIGALPNTGGLIGSNLPLYIGKWMQTFDAGWGYRYFIGEIDDVAIYNIVLLPSSIQKLYTSQSFAWNTGETTSSIIVTPSADTTYSWTVTQGNSTCTASVDIVVNPVVTNTISASIIEGETYTLGTQTLTTAGTYTEVFTSAEGCDSTVTLTLAVEPLLTCNITAPVTTICSGDSAILQVQSNFLSSEVGVFNAIQDQGIAINGSIQDFPVGNFTYEVWFNVDREIYLLQEKDGSSTGLNVIAVNGQNYLIFPTFYSSGPYYRGTGISVGTNGFCVIEHFSGFIDSRMTVPMNLIGWHHVAVVYQNSSFKVYIDGNYIGERSNQTFGQGNFSQVAALQSIGFGYANSILNMVLLLLS